MGIHEASQVKVKINPVKLSFSIFCFLFVLTTALVSAFALSNARVSADSTASASVTVTSACTLSGGGNNYSGNINPGSSREFGTSTIKAVCNDSNGYALYAVGFTGDSYTGDNNKLVGSTSSINAGNSGTDSYWAMKLSSVAGTYAPTIENSFDSYQGIPASFTKVASLTSSTDMGPSATGSSVDATYKVNVSSAQASDTYNGKVKYVLVHPNTATTGTYTINYYANGGTGTMSSETDLYNFEDHTLASSTFTPPTGYQLAGWCTVQDNTASGVVSSADPQTTCHGKSYSPEGTVLASTVEADGTLDLYAYWQLGQYNITLDQNLATTPGSTNTTATYLATTLGGSTPITLPERNYAITGFSLPSGNNADGATVSFNPGSSNCTSASNCNYTYSFNGWYQEAATTNRIADNTTLPALLPSTAYTNSSSQWIATEDKTLYAGWTSPEDPVSLPSITKTGYDCGWTTTSSGATTITYPSTTANPYPTITPNANTTLYGVCTLKTNLSLRISFDSNVESVAVHSVSALGPTVGTVTASGDSVSGLTYNTNYFLVPTYASGYEFDSWAQDSGAVGELSSTTAANPYYRIGDGTNGVTLASKSSKIYMQDLTLANCAVNVGQGSNPAGVGDELTVYDKRTSNYASGDDASYTVRYINGECWMTQNLRITGTISATDSNFSGSDFNVSQYDLKTDGASGGVCNGTNGYSNVCSRTPDDTDLSTIGGDATAKSVGAWYNYMAATAGTISGSSNSTAATSDICPAGWHLPSGPNTTSNTDFNKLVGNTTSGWQDPTTGLSAFGAVYGGHYSNGSLGSTGNGYWWPTTAGSTTRRYHLYYNSSSGQFSGTSNNYRYRGFFVRCLLKPTMQEATSQSLAAAMPNVGDITMLADARDGQDYTVGRLADGNYWMLDNLAIDLTDSNVKFKMYNSNDTKTNASYTTLGYLFNGGGTTSNKYATIGISSIWNDSSSYSAPLINTSSKNVIPTDTTSTSGDYKVGGYYNFCAASAGSYCYGNGINAGTSSGNAAEDICPSSWRMPTGGSSGEYKTLYSNSNYKNYDNYRAALHLPLSGYYDSAWSSDVSYFGYFW